MRNNEKLSMRIAVDLDGVLANTMVSFCRILNERRSINLNVDSFTQWHAWEIAGITKDEFFRTLDQAWFKWQSIPPMEPQLREKVDRLKEFGRVEIVTGRSPETVRNAKSWLQKHGIPHDAFIRTESTRAKINLGYDVFIDDSAELMALIASTLDKNGVLYTQPWNRAAPAMPRIFRVSGWDQIPGALRQLAAKAE